MLDIPLLYLIVKVAAVAASYLMAGYVKTDITESIISVLSFACVFVLELLIGRICRKKAFLYITVLSSIIACILIGTDILFPLLVVLLMHLFELILSAEMYYQVTIISLILVFILYQPKMDFILLSLVFILMIFLIRILIFRLKDYISKNEMLKEEIIKLENNISDLKSTMKNLKAAVSMDERNRIAAKIHDEIGHGISGSIILLEAAMLQMKDDRKKAADTVEKAVANLRESVDTIRSSLKEERTDRFMIDIKDISAVLSQFKASYNISTRLKTSGDLSNISPEQWVCIHDNLKECLTNVLKHSNATEFLLNIQVFKKIIKVEYKDNGRTSPGFEKHLGLNAIEERTVKAKGRCFINKSENGFVVTNIFNY